MNNLHETMRTMTKKSQKGILNIEEQDTNSENPFQWTQRLDGAEGGNQSNRGQVPINANLNTKENKVQEIHK